jgi:hypothetical protein
MRYTDEAYKRAAKYARLVATRAFNDQPSPPPSADNTFYNAVDAAVVALKAMAPYFEEEE